MSTATGAQARVVATELDSVSKIHTAKYGGLSFALDLTKPQHHALHRIVATRQTCVDDYFDRRSSTETKLHCLEMFEHCNTQIKLVLGL